MKILLIALVTASTVLGDVVLFDEPQTFSYDKVGVKITPPFSTGIINTCSYNNPYSGLTCIEGTGVGNYGTGGGCKVSISLGPGWIDPTQFTAFTYWVRQKNIGTGRMDIHCYDTAGQVGVMAPVGQPVGNFGLNRNNITSYQKITIPISAFAFPVGRYINRFTFDMVEQGGFYIDYVVLIGSGVVQQPRPWPTPTPCP